jgi:uncharacterized protein YqeY
MKLREISKRDILRMVMAKAKDIAKKDKNREVTDLDLLSAIQKQIKQNKETLEFLKKDNRDCSEAENEIEILSTYLPEQMSKDRMAELVRGIVNNIPEDQRNQKARGIVMKELSKHKDTLDMKEAGAFAATLLS